MRRAAEGPAQTGPGIASMPIYRCYFLDGKLHITDAEVFEAPEDGAALALARARLADRMDARAELWEGARLVEIIRPESRRRPEA